MIFAPSVANHQKIHLLIVQKMKYQLVSLHYQIRISPLGEGEAEPLVKVIYETRMVIDVIQIKSKKAALDPCIFEQIALKDD